MPLTPNLDTMVVIFSQDVDHTTTAVIDWLTYYKAPFKRINGSQFYRNFNLTITKSGAQIDLNQLDHDKIKTVWLWRWSGYEERLNNVLVQERDSIDPLKLQLNQFFRSELRTLTSFYFDFIPEEKKFSRAALDELNKLTVLKKAQEAG